MKKPERRFQRSFKDSKISNKKKWTDWAYRYLDIWRIAIGLIIEGVYKKRIIGEDYYCNIIYYGKPLAKFIYLFTIYFLNLQSTPICLYLLPNSVIIDHLKFLQRGTCPSPFSGGTRGEGVMGNDSRAYNFWWCYYYNVYIIK